MHVDKKPPALSPLVKHTTVKAATVRMQNFAPKNAASSRSHRVAPGASRNPIKSQADVSNLLVEGKGGSLKRSSHLSSFATPPGGTFRQHFFDPTLKAQ